MYAALIMMFVFVDMPIVQTPVEPALFQSLSYHDVRFERGGKPGMHITVQDLFDQFMWLRKNGFNVISVDDLIAARDGSRPLPSKAVLLSFDDGLRSVYEVVFPMLKIFGYKAVVAPVTSWVETERTVIYEGQKLNQDAFLTWDQLREMQQSGLIEVASHTHDLHRGLVGNAYGNLQPAATVRVYDHATQTYENDSAWQTRVASDLKASSESLKQNLGKAPRVLIWPYGKYNHKLVDLAAEAGMPFTLGLGSQANRLDHLDRIGRYLVPDKPDLAHFGWSLNHPEHLPERRIVHVDIDYIFDPKDVTQQKRNLDALLDRVKEMGVTDVFLQAFADSDGDGVADSAYFPNRHLPMREDLFNRVAWQLKTRCGVKVFAWMPVLAFTLAPEKEGVYVVRDGDDPEKRYTRLSAFDSHSREMILEIYEDLGRYCDFDGLLFHDDAFYRDDEEAGEQAMAWYEWEWGLPGDIQQLRDNYDLRKRWSKLKTEHLTDFTMEIKARTERWRAPLWTARNIYARLIVQPDSQEWFAQSYKNMLEHYDYTAIMAMPYMEQAEDAESWLVHLAQLAQCYDPQFRKTIFELQSQDWRTQTPVPAETMVRHMELLVEQGVQQFGYYPDDFIFGRPNLEIIKEGFKLR